MTGAQEAKGTKVRTRTSGTSSSSSSSKASTKQKDVAEAITAATLTPPPQHEAQANKFIHFFQTYWSQALLGVIALIAGYFSGIFGVKEDITSLRVETASLKSDVSHAEKDIAELKQDTKAIPDMSARLRVLEIRSSSTQPPGAAPTTAQK